MQIRHVALAKMLLLSLTKSLLELMHLDSFL